MSISVIVELGELREAEDVAEQVAGEDGAAGADERDLRHRLTELASQDRDERHHLAGVAAEVVGERERRGRLRDLALLGRLAAQLRASTSNIMRRPDAPTGWPKLFRPPSGFTGMLAVEVERAREHLLPRGAPLGEPRSSMMSELGGREAVVHLGHRDLRRAGR